MTEERNSELRGFLILMVFAVFFVYLVIIVSAIMTVEKVKNIGKKSSRSNNILVGSTDKSLI